MPAIRKKQVTGEAEWWAAYEQIPEEWPKQRLESLVDQTIAEIVATVGTRKAAYAWSGGKDSMVLGLLAEQAGITESMLVITNLEYMEFLRWVTDHMPHGLEILNTGQDLEWLARNLDLLFPPNATVAMRWFRQVQHAGQRSYFRDNQLDLLLLGRRRSDGNYVGPPGQRIYSNRQGVTRYSPLADWPHEAVLAYIYWHSLDLAPHYRWPRGFRVGTGPWPARQWCDSHDHGFSEVHQIDPTILPEAAPYVPEAAAWLDAHG